jgi:hypothetical protein
VPWPPRGRDPDPPLTDDRRSRRSTEDKPEPGQDGRPRLFIAAVSFVYGSGPCPVAEAAYGAAAAEGDACYDAEVDPVLVAGRSKPF